jgi:glycosyltransferase involved in cell wall biosynthesis/peptidoglycan/xylan/chitin deacetylase (PgdA/CDA1 family)
MFTAQHLRRPRLLIMAYACSPLRGSESAVGWNRAVQAAKHFDTWVICEKREFEPDISRYLKEHGDIPGLNFVFVPMPRRQWSLGQLHGALWYMMLNLWHRRAYAVARRLHEQIGFDLVHQLTFCGFREPGYLWKLDVPFVWGPVGGTQNYPWNFITRAGWGGAAREAGRNILNLCQLRFNRRINTAARKADALVAATSTVRRDFSRFQGITPNVISDVGITRITHVSRPLRSAQEPLRIVWSGIMQLRKALPLLIDALAQMPDDVPYCLRVLGEGEYLDSWRRHARRRGIDRRIEWLGWQPHEQALKQYAWADVFAFTSLRDTTGTVIAEALAAGLPVVCLDHQGAHDVVTDDCGIKIPVSTPRNVVGGLREAFVRLARDPAECERLSRGAVQRARDYLWTTQGEKMAKVYHQVLGISPDDWRKETSVYEIAAGFAENESFMRQNQERLACHAGGNFHAPGDSFGEFFYSARRSSEKSSDKLITTRLRSAAQHAAGCAAVPMNFLFGDRHRNSFGILTYHRIAPFTPGVPAPTWNVTPDRFRSQMCGLLAKGFRPWPLRKAVDYHHKGLHIPSNVFVVTFDDGYECVYGNAWPILKELRIPATMFIVTGWLDSNTPMPCEDWPAAGSHLVPASAWRSISIKQCREILADGLIDLGVHTHWHEDYRGRPIAFHHDVNLSMQTMHRLFGDREIAFAFPYGYTDSELTAIAQSTGVICALTANKEVIDPLTDPFDWGRLNVEQYDSGTTLAAKLSGWYGAIYGCFRALKRSRQKTSASKAVYGRHPNAHVRRSAIQQ